MRRNKRVSEIGICKYYYDCRFIIVFFFFLIIVRFWFIWRWEEGENWIIYTLDNTLLIDKIFLYYIFRKRINLTSLTSTEENSRSQLRIEIVPRRKREGTVERLKELMELKGLDVSSWLLSGYIYIPHSSFRNILLPVRHNKRQYKTRSAAKFVHSPGWHILINGPCRRDSSHSPSSRRRSPSPRRRSRSPKRRLWLIPLIWLYPLLLYAHIHLRYTDSPSPSSSWKSRRFAMKVILLFPFCCSECVHVYNLYVYFAIWVVTKKFLVREDNKYLVWPFKWIKLQLRR